MTGVTLDYAASGRSTRIVGLSMAVALHLVVVFLLLQLESVRSAITAAVPITVNLISPPKKVKPDILPKPLPVKPRVHKPKPVEMPPITTVVTEQPAAFVATPPPPVPVVGPPEVVVTAPPAPYVPVAPPPPPVTPPNFNADYLNNPPPAYPVLSRRMGEEGRVVLRVFVNEQGQPTQVQLRTSSGHTRLDDAALTTVRQWKFVPARRGDTPVGAWVLVPISFTLRS
jgi:periplasmic protein TonB